MDVPISNACTQLQRVSAGVRNARPFYRLNVSKDCLRKATGTGVGRCSSSMHDHGAGPRVDNVFGSDLVGEGE